MTFLKVLGIIGFIILSIGCALIGAVLGCVIGAMYVPICISDGRASTPVEIVTGVFNGSDQDQI
jgi:hypothetical protein